MPELLQIVFLLNEPQNMFPPKYISVSYDLVNFLSLSSSSYGIIFPLSTAIVIVSIEETHDYYLRAEMVTTPRNHATPIYYGTTITTTTLLVPVLRANHSTIQHQRWRTYDLRGYQYINFIEYTQIINYIRQQERKVYKYICTYIWIYK